MAATVLIEVSARHCHLSKTDVEKLFGPGHQLTPFKPLSQPGQFAANETVTVKTEAGAIERIRVLGPARDITQVELAVTDARKLKIKPVYRQSGSIDATPGATLVGPKGEVKMEKGVIIAMRHVHVDPATAEKLKLKDKSMIKVKSLGDRSVVFENVLVRVHKDFAFAMHIDTDEGNAALVDGGSCQGEIIA